MAPQATPHLQLTYVGRLLDGLAARDRVGLVIAAHQIGLVGR